LKMEKERLEKEGFQVDHEGDLWINFII
jgi:hypothetical protein